MAGWMLLEQNRSSSGGGLYDLRRGGDLVLYCTCRGWLSNKNAHRKARQEHLPAECKHTKAYVARTGASYGPQYENVASAALSSSFKKSVKKVAVLDATPAASAPGNWRDLLLQERKTAEQRGLRTPAAAFAEFKQEVSGRFANLDMEDDAPVVALPVAASRALDVE